MQFEITDNAAITFAEEFYSAISDGYPIDGALSEARTAIFAQGNDIEWGTPVYFTRAPDGKLFSLEQISASDYNFSEKIQTGQIISDEYLEGLYLDGLKAYVRKDWEKAIKRFEAIFILRRDPPQQKRKRRYYCHC